MIKRVLFVCDGNEDVGLGHFSRCLTIAIAMKGFPFQLGFSGNFNVFAQNRLVTEQIDQIELGAGSFQTALVVDGYAHTQKSLTELKRCCSHLIVIDDFDNYRYPCVDAIINFRFAAETFIESTEKHILGVKYFPFQASLREVRLNSLQKASSGQTVRKILVIIGAADRFLVMDKLIEALDSVLSGCRLTVLASQKPAYQPKSNELQYYSFVDNIAHFYGGHDVVISGGGSVKYESGFCVRPNAALSQTELQRQDTLLLQQHQLCFDLGLAQYSDLKSLKESLSRFFSIGVLQAQRQSMIERFNSESTRDLVECIVRFLDVKK